MGSQVVIVGKNYSTTLGIIKSVGEAGYRCGVVACVGKHPKHPSPETLSKYVDTYVYARTRDDNDIISKLLDNYAEEGKRKTLIPADDYSVALFDKNYEMLSRYFIIPAADNRAGELTKIMDKAVQKRTAVAAGLSVAKTWIIDIKKEVNIPDQISFPCFVKPLESYRDPATKTFIRKCDSLKDLIEHLNLSKQKGVEQMLIEEFVPFSEEYTIPGVAIGDEIIIPAIVKKLKTAQGQHKGVTVIGKVEAIDQDLLHLLQNYVRELKFEGLFDVEVFRYNDRYFFNEINLRSSAAGYVITSAGVNLPGIFVDYKQGIPWDRNISKLKYGITFLSEKAEIQEYYENLCSWRTFTDEMKAVDVCFMTDKGDPWPRKAFILIAALTILRKIKKECLK